MSQLADNTLEIQIVNIYSTNGTVVGTSQVGFNGTVTANATAGAGGQAEAVAGAAGEASVIAGVTVSTTLTTGIYQGVYVYNPKYPYFIPDVNMNVHVIARNFNHLNGLGFGRVSK